MAVRRSCDPINVKRIWDAMRQSNVNHMTCDSARIFKIMQKVDYNYTQPQVELYIKQAVKDALILPTRNNRTENSSQTYKITDQELPEFDGKDWYCFECHLAGNVQACNKCFRVFHSDCTKSAKKKFENHKNKTTSDADLSMDINSSNQSFNTSNSADTSSNNIVYDENLCSICNIVNIDEPKLEKNKINYLLKFVLRRVRAWVSLPNTITHTMAQEDRPNWLTDSELTWRANQLFFEHKDMSVMDVNLNTEIYVTLTDFLADMLTIQHNVAIFHGNSQEYQATEFMIRDTIHDLTEIRNCPDCYKHSNEKINANWFVLPCKTQHKLVWAKQKGYPYWPAKVIRETSTHTDVRFFGGKHERSVLHKSFVKPITVSKESLKIKTSANFNRAYEELVHHQKILADPGELEKILSDVKKKRPSKVNTLVPPPKPKAKPVKRGRPARPSSSASSNADKSEKVDKLEKSAPEPKKQKQETKEEKASCSTISGNNVIDISDCEEEEEGGDTSVNDVPQSSFGFEDNSCYEQVSSSTENCNMMSGPQQEAAMQPLDQPYCDAVEEMRTKLETLQNKKDLIKCAMDCMQLEISKVTNNHNDYLKKIFESHNAQISETKKKQWCYNCEQDAIYHCCWNTAYCSQTCQQQHWQSEHKKVCRRKRPV